MQSPRSRFGRPVIEPGSGLFKLGSQAKERSLIPKAGGKLNAYGEAIVTPI